jgi:hypothetical protein
MKTNCYASLLTGLTMLAATGLGAAEYEKNLAKEFPAVPGGKLVIEADRGSMEIATDGSDKVRVRVLRKVKGGSKEQADDLFADHEVTIGQEGNTVSVVAKSKSQRNWSVGFGRRSIEVRYQVNIPGKFDVDLRTAGGDIHLGRLDGTAFTRTSSGSIQIETVTGKVEAANSGGNIQIQGAGGSVTAHTSSGAIKILKATGSIEVANSGGNINVEEAGGAVVAATSSGSITLASVKGDIEARNSGGDIKIDSAGGNVAVRTSSGSIRLGVIYGKEVKARNSGGDIEVAESAGAVSAETSSGSIRIKLARGAIVAKDSGGDIGIGEAGDDVTAQTSSGKITIKTAKGKVVAKNSGGDVSIDEVGGESTVRTSSGSIRIGLARGKVEAKNSGGKIEVAEARSSVLAETSSGPIAVSFSAVPKGDSRLEVSGGGITLALPRSAGVTLDARTSGGKVVTDMPVTLTVQGEHQGGALQGKINGGGPAMLLRASAGDIHLKESAATSTPAELETPSK